MLWAIIMDNLKLWALSLCGALVITSVFRLIISGSRLEKSVNVFLSVFIFFYSIIPLSNITEIDDLSFNFEVEEKEDEIYLDGYEMVVVESIKKVCNENNVSVISVDIDSYLDDKNEYTVNEIIVEIDSPERANEIKSVLENQLNFEVEVV